METHSVLLITAAAILLALFLWVKIRGDDHDIDDGDAPALTVEPLGQAMGYREPRVAM